MDSDKQITRRLAVGACFSFTCEPHFLPVIQPWGDTHGDGAGAVHCTGTSTVGAGISNHLPRAAAVHAGCGKPECPLVFRGKPGAVAVSAGRRVSGFGSRAVTSGTRCLAGELYGQCCTLGGFPEVQRNIRFHVRSPLGSGRVAWGTPATAAAVEESTENIAKATTIG